VQGIHNTANDSIHVVELEVHDDEPPPLNAEVELFEIIPPGAESPPEPSEQMRFPSRGEPLDPGVVLDSYRLLELLGEGHSAAVWRAEVLAVPPGVLLRKGDTVAIKVYNDLLLQGTESIRIQREFKVAAQVNHPSLAKVYDVVISPSRPMHTFLVMEYVVGQTLREHVADHGPLTARDVMTIGRQLFDALAALHARGAVHRDVKAANIVLVDPLEHEIKLLDFGIVSLEREKRLTEGSVFLGSKHSAPLEQLTGRPLDRRADIYGVGAVMFHCYGGRPPYDMVGPEGAIVEKMLQEPETLHPKDKDDEALTAFINRCMALKPKDRPSTSMAARSELDSLLGIRGTS
jgi:serine/threonine-protein kinase